MRASLYIYGVLLPVMAAAADKIAPRTLAFLEQTSVSGYVQTSFQYTLDHHGAPGVAGGRQFNNSGTSFSVDQVKLTLESPLDENEFAAGYRVDLLAGSNARRIHPSGDGPLDAEQAYVNFRLPLGHGLEVKFGRFATPAGAEAIDAPVNWFYSHSYIFSFGEPFTHTGALLSYRWNDALDTQLGVVNGWDVAQDNNSAKTLLGRAGLTLLDGKLRNAVTIIGGPEQPGNDSDWRWIADDVLTWQPPMENLTLMINGLYGHEDSALDSAGFRHNGAVAWWSTAVAARYQWTPLVTLAMRYEYFSDADGARTDAARGIRPLIGPDPTPAMGFARRGGVDYQAVTCSAWLTRVFPNFTPRLEVRWDRASEPVLRPRAASSGTVIGAETTQVTFSLDAVYVF